MADRPTTPGPATAWAVPDSRAEEPPRTAGPAVTAVPLGSPAAPALGAAHRGGPELPVPLRPMTTSDRIDGALRILKLAPGTVLALAAVAVVPVHLVAALVLRGEPGLGDGDNQLVAALGRPLVAVFVQDAGGEVAVALLLVLLEVLAVSVVAAGLARLVSGWYAGRARRTAELLAETGRQLPAIAAAWALVHLAEAPFAAVLFVPVIVPMSWFAVTAPVIGAEGVGPVAALRRSFRLSRPAMGTVLGTCLLAATVDAVLRFALTAVGQLYVDLELPAATLAAMAIGIGARLVTVPFVAGCAVLLYLDLRVRHEGLDIELAAVERFPDVS